MAYLLIILKTIANISEGVLIKKYNAKGALAIIQKMQQLRFDNECNIEFMIIGLAVSASALLAGSILKERKHLKEIFHYGIPYAGAAGAAICIFRSCVKAAEKRFRLLTEAALVILIIMIIAFILPLQSNRTVCRTNTEEASLWGWVRSLNCRSQPGRCLYHNCREHAHQC